MYFQATRFTAVGNSQVNRHFPVATAQSFMQLSAEAERRNSDLADHFFLFLKRTCSMRGKGNA